MSKELEALANLFGAVEEEYSGCCVMKEFDENKSIIEKALKDKEDYDELCKWFGVTFPQLREALVLYKTFDIEKAKKREQALEIIKSKHVDTYMLLQGCSLHEYNQKYKSKRTRLLANEYNLLKERLL